MMVVYSRVLGYMIELFGVTGAKRAYGAGGEPAPVELTAHEAKSNFTDPASCTATTIIVPIREQRHWCSTMLGAGYVLWRHE